MLHARHICTFSDVSMYPVLYAKAANSVILSAVYRAISPLDADPIKHPVTYGDGSNWWQDGDSVPYGARAGDTRTVQFAKFSDKIYETVLIKRAHFYAFSHSPVS